MKKHALQTARYLVLAGIIAFGAYYTASHYDTFSEKADFAPSIIILLVVLNLVTIAAESLRLKLMIRKLGTNLPFRESWRMMTIMQAFNHIVLKAGTFSGGYYLSKRHGISFHGYVAFVVTYVVIMVLASGIFGGAVAVFYLLAGEHVAPAVFPLYGMLLAGTLGFIAVAHIRWTPSFLPKFLQTILGYWREIYTDYRLIVTMIAVECLYFASCTLRFLVAVRVFSQPVGFLESAVVTTVGNFLRVASIMPGGLGIAELASGWTSGILGQDAGLSGLAAGFDRVVYVGLVFVFGALGFFTLTSGRELFRKPADKEMISRTEESP